jgi:hypothetical protein
MNLQAIVNDIKTLPPEKQEEVADFIAFLKNRLGIREKHESVDRTPVRSGGFFGMWADREDMKDSSQWVRGVRRKEMEKDDA